MKDRKHAYLIMAHNDLDTLEYLLKTLDDPRNDIYLHMDIKFNEPYEERLKKCVKKSDLFFTERMDVRWGTYSQIEGELLVLRSAIVGCYNYYHLLSGNDLPIKSQDIIHAFFDENEGKEFVSFYRKEINADNFGKLGLYHFNFGWYRLNHFSIWIQKLLHIDRIKTSGMTYMKGANWFSITHELAEYLLSQTETIHKLFHHTKNGDEVFLQTLVYNSRFKDRVYSQEYNDVEYRVLDSKRAMGNMRAVEWPDSLGTAHPKTLTMGDYDLIVNSKALFARKFSAKSDIDVMNKLYKNIVVDFEYKD